MVREVLILSARAADYARLLAAMPLPPLSLHVAAGAADAEPWLATCEIVLADPPLVRPLLERMAALRWLQSTYAGVETLTAPGLRRDYLLTNARGVFGELMAEYVMGYVIMHERRGWQRFLAQREGRWDATWPGRLRGKTLGLAGVGSIGAEIARVAQCFGLRGRRVGVVTSVLTEPAGTMSAKSASAASGVAGLAVIAATWAPKLLALRARVNTVSVRPLPERASNRSPGAMAGVVASPTMCAVNPSCISRMANIRSSSPLRPSPNTKIRRARRMASSNASAWASSSRARMALTSSRS